ncbi:MAG TPA: class I SAM-dependent methyltransferase [Thermoanaerobaculia bacterium]|nr:class I SAM-dependent methyltransferase [Thermoanaerobaculia bacterium]
MTSTKVAPHPPLQEYYGAEPREEYVRTIFDETAPWYDWTTWFLSFGSGDRYRRQALERAGLAPGMKLLDLASGTGVVARAAAQVTKDPRAIVGMDASFGMLLSGKTGNAKVQSPAECLALRDSSFDRISIGFALRHFADLSVVFSECRRVLRPGGKIVILEITAPESRIARAVLGVYMGRLAPIAIRLKTGSARAAELCRYYWETTRDCVRPAVITDALRAAGFEDVQRRIELGIFSEYTGSRPGRQR